MVQLPAPDPSVRPAHYRWPWFLLAALLVGLMIGGLALYREARRVHRAREDGTMRQPDLRLNTNQ